MSLDCLCMIKFVRTKLIKRLSKFHQIYSLSAVGDKKT